MKNYLLALVTIVASLTIALAIYKSSTSNSLFLKNVEALAFEEDSEYADCFTFYTDALDDDLLAVYVRVCTGCSYELVTSASVKAFCKK